MAIDLHIGFLLDASGSMKPKRHETIESVNAYLTGIQADPEMREDVFSAALFNSGTGFKTILERVPLPLVGKLTADDYKCEDLTPLIDSTIDMLNLLQKDIDAGRRALLVVMTDGQENASHRSTKELRERLDRMRATGRFKSVWLGRDIDAWDVVGSAGARTSVLRSDTFSYTGGQALGMMVYAAQATRGLKGASMSATGFFDGYKPQPQVDDDNEPNLRRWGGGTARNG